MTTGQIVVITMRIVIPLMILKRPLAGGIIAMLLDAFDVVIVELFGEGGMGEHYHSIDKILDLYHLTLELIVALSWVQRIPRLTAVGLYVYRLAGVILFELTQVRAVLFLFPNLFEHWFLFYLIRNRFFPNIRLDTWRQTIVWLVILYIPKLGQEYLLHVAEAQPWDWVKNLLGI